MRPKHNFNHGSVSGIALFTAACALTLATSGVALAQSVPIGPDTPAVPCIPAATDVPCIPDGGDGGGGDGGDGGGAPLEMALGATTGQIHRLVSQRLAFAPDTPPGWATVFGTRSRRGEEGLALALKHSFYGVIGGYDAQTESGQRVGLFLGFGRGKVRTSDITSFTDTATRGFVGVYGQHVIGDLTLNGSLVFGHAQHKSSRTVLDNLAGLETARGSYTSTTISPSLSLNWSRALPNGFELRPSAQIAYTYGSYSGYTETGATNANLTFGKRSVNIVDTRLQLALAQPFAARQGESPRARARSSGAPGSPPRIMAATGPAPNWAAAPPHLMRCQATGPSLAALSPGTLHYVLGDRISLDSSVEYARTSGSVGALSGQFGLMFRF